MSTQYEENLAVTATLEQMAEMNDTEVNNSTYNFHNSTDDHYDIIKQPGVQALFYLIYGTIFVLGLFGNVLVCYVVCRNKAMQTVTNFFITNLALSDILLCMLGVPFTPLYTFLEKWIFGRVLCHLVPYAQGTSIYISSLTLTSIAIDRFFVIIYPFKPRMRLTTCLFIITSIWVFALISTLPYAIWLQYGMIGDHQYTCSEDWPNEAVRQVFSGFTATMQFILPFSLITFCYIRVSVKLSDRARTKPGTKNSKKEAIERERKRRTNRMLIAMVTIFGIAWLPLSLVNLLSDVSIEADSWKYYNFCFFLAHSLAMSSTCYNPFLYAWLNENFRKEFKQVLPCFNVVATEGNRVRRFLSERTCNGNETVQESFVPASAVHDLNATGGKHPVMNLETIEEQTSVSQTAININYDQATAKYSTMTNQVEIHIPDTHRESPKSDLNNDTNALDDDDGNYSDGGTIDKLEEVSLTAQV